MATNLPSCFSIEFLEQLLKFLVNFTLLKYVKSQTSYGFLTTKKLIFGFQILDLKDHFSASLKGGDGSGANRAKTDFAKFLKMFIVGHYDLKLALLMNMRKTTRDPK